ncbi:hypothetical protein BKA66DRAFT_263966 [Pyrenochaeta sp. MPI-SDFR-AT-0127]|nr:hypothetical protein BKA66DRAFT_263966 [Pyrenochaeta sp. MPI-SDFR-AT-0127]
MALSTHAISQIRRYSTQLPRDPHYRLKATLATGYVVSALALPFVPPLLETRRAKADGSYLTSREIYVNLLTYVRPGKMHIVLRNTLDVQDKAFSFT